MERTDSACWDGGAALTAIVMLSLIGIAACQGGRSAEDPLSRLRDALPVEVNGWRAEGEPNIYDTETIFAYIDGHAEVYLACGMQRCLAVRYTGADGEGDVILDLFEMASSEDAYGVSTHDRDGEAVAIGNDGLVLYGWLSFWKGPYFVSLYAEDESEGSRSAVMELGRAVADLIDQPGRRPGIIERLPAAGLDPRSLSFLRSYQILNSHVYLGEDNPLGLGPDTSAALGRYQREEETGLLLIVEYPDSSQCQDAERAFADLFLGGGAEGVAIRTENDRWYAMRSEGTRLAAVLEADAEQLASDLIRDAGLEDAP
jgi:hypothetical protein